MPKLPLGDPKHFKFSINFQGEQEMLHLGNVCETFASKDFRCQMYRSFGSTGAFLDSRSIPRLQHVKVLGVAYVTEYRKVFVKCKVSSSNFGQF